MLMAFDAVRIGLEGMPVGCVISTEVPVIEVLEDVKSLTVWSVVVSSFGVRS